MPRQSDAKGAAFANVTGKANLAAEQLAELLHDRQTESSTGILPSQVIALQDSVALTELFKDDFKVAFRNPHACIADRDMKVIGIDGAGGDRHQSAFRCELDRIGQQIIHDLLYFGAS